MTDMCKRIDALLNEKGISGAKMSIDLGMSRSFMTELRKGRAKSVRIETAQKIADYLNVPVDYLLTGIISPDETPDNENPHEVELRDTFVSLDVEDQIYVKNWVNTFAQNPEKAKEAPADAGKRSVSDDDLKFALFGDCENVSDDDLADVLRYAAFVQERKKDQK